MVDFENRNWQLLVKLEKMAGFWPYHKKVRRLAAKIAMPLIVLSCTTAMVIRIRKEWNVNIDIVIENTLIALTHFSIMVKLSVCMVDKPRREIFERIATHIETLVEEEEVAIMKNYYNKAETLVIRFAAFTCITFGIFDSLPVARMFLDYFFGDGTLKKETPFFVDYLVDEQKYFIYIVAHITMVGFTAIIIELSFELYFFLTIRHICALFEIVKLRLKAASDIFDQYSHNNKITNSDEQKAFKIISSAVELHNEAKTLVKSVNEIYRNCLFIILLLNMAGFAPLPVTVIVYLNYPLELFRRALLVAVALVHFYVVFLQGQMIIDHSSSVFDTCYNFCWFNSSKRCRFAISIIMIQSVKPCRLTGIFFYLSMGTYCQMLKTALSYISMFAALDFTIKL